MAEWAGWWYLLLSQLSVRLAQPIADLLGVVTIGVGERGGTNQQRRRDGNLPGALRCSACHGPGIGA